MLDEPTTFLDVAHEMAIFELLSSLARSGLAVLLVSHQLNLVARFADTIVLLNEGRIATSGAPTDVMKADRLESIYGWPVVDHARSRGRRSGARAASAPPHSPMMTTAFLSLTQP